jgi:hypothetical protein
LDEQSVPAEAAEDTAAEEVVAPDVPAADPAVVVAPAPAKKPPKKATKSAAKPAATGVPRRASRDTLTYDGATAIARRVEGYWAERGCKVACTVVPVKSATGKSTLFAVRSNLLFGLPR